MKEDIMAKVIIGMATLIIGIFGGTAVAGSTDSTVTSSQSDKMDKIATSINNVDKNLAVVKVKVDNIEYEFRDMESRLSDLEKDSYSKKK